MFASFVGLAADWTGRGASAAWSNPANWSGGRVPRPFESVVIDGNHSVLVTNSTVVAGLVLRGGAILTVRGSGVYFESAGPGELSGRSLVALDGASILLSAISSIPILDGDFHEFRAEGVGSRIAFPAVASLEMWESVHPAEIIARAGGRVELAALSRVDASALNLTVDGTGSSVDFSKLSSLNGCNLLIRGAKVDQSFPALKSLTGGSVQILDGAIARFQALSQLSAGGVPGETNLIRVKGADGRLEASSVAFINGHTNGGVLQLQAQVGGLLKLGGLTEIRGGSVEFLAEDFASLELISLRQWMTTAPRCALEARRAASLYVPLPMLVSGVRISGVRIGLQDPWPRTLPASTNLFLLGSPQSAFSIGFRTNDYDGAWKFLGRIALSNSVTQVSSSGDSMRGYRLRVSPLLQDPPSLEIYRGKSNAQRLVLFGRPNGHYLIEGSTGGLDAPFGPVAEVDTTNSVGVVSLGSNREPTGFFRACDTALSRRRPLGNRLTYLEGGEHFYPNIEFPSFTTEQWVGDSTTEAVVTISVDDLKSDYNRYEALLRPILNRLKSISGKSPLSIFCIGLDPSAPMLQKWLAEGVTLESHTSTHPCPLIGVAGIESARTNFLANVERVGSVPGNRLTCFRMPCCDGENSATPRFYSELFAQRTLKGQGVFADSSVMNVFSIRDRSLPRDLVMDADGVERFRKYIPSTLGTYVEDYPYPFVIGRLGWELPVATPSDNEARYINGNTNAVTLGDWKAGIDATVLRRGIFNFAFHPFGWTSPEQVVQLLDHVATYGPRVRVMTVREVVDRIVHNALGGEPLRTTNGGDNGVRLLDLNNDGYMDVVIGNGRMRRTRVWNPAGRAWVNSGFPISLVLPGDEDRPDPAVHFGLLPSGYPFLLALREAERSAWRFDGVSWQMAPELLNGLEIDGKPLIAARGTKDLGVRLRDVNAEGGSELLLGNDMQSAVFHWEPTRSTWSHEDYELPEGASIVDASGRDNGTRFVDLNGDGFDDIVVSNPQGYAVHLFTPGSSPGWRSTVLSIHRPGGAAVGARPAGVDGEAAEAEGCPCADPEESMLKGDAGVLARQLARRSGHATPQAPAPAGPARLILPPFVRAEGPRDNGAWFKDGYLYVQSEDTALYKNYCARIPFKDLLGK